MADACAAPSPRLVPRRLGAPVSSARGCRWLNRVATQLVDYSAFELVLTLIQTHMCGLQCRKVPAGHTPIVTTGFGSRGQLDLIDFQSMPDGQFKWLATYRDHGE